MNVQSKSSLIGLSSAWSTAHRHRRLPERHPEAGTPAPAGPHSQLKLKWTRQHPGGCPPDGARARGWQQRPAGECVHVGTRVPALEILPQGGKGTRHCGCIAHLVRARASSVTFLPSSYRTLCRKTRMPSLLIGSSCTMLVTFCPIMHSLHVRVEEGMDDVEETCIVDEGCVHTGSQLELESRRTEILSACNTCNSVWVWNPEFEDCAPHLSQNIFASPTAAQIHSAHMRRGCLSIAVACPLPRFEDPSPSMLRPGS
eukprot:365104-Chlamydomonas_euryale.AAC.13